MSLNFLKFFSPEKYKLINLLDNISYSSISLSPSNSFFQILNFTSLLFIFFISKMIFYTERHKYRFYFFLSVIGFIASVIALLFYLNGNPDFLIFKNSYYKNASTGFFINRTVFSVFLLFCLISCLELLKNYEEVTNSRKKDYFFPKIYIRCLQYLYLLGL